MMNSHLLRKTSESIVLKFFNEMVKNPDCFTLLLKEGKVTFAFDQYQLKEEFNFDELVRQIEDGLIRWEQENAKNSQAIRELISKAKAIDPDSDDLK